MRWEDEQFIKVYTRDTVDWLALSYDARSLFLNLLRKVDRAGILPLGRHGKRAVAVMVGAPELWESRLAPALEELLADGCCRVEGDRLVVPKYVEAQSARQSDTARKAAQRQRDREQALASGATGSVTGLDIQAAMSRAASHGVTHAVTSGHTASHGVTPRRDETRREETREDLLSGSEPRPHVSDISADEDPLPKGCEPEIHHLHPEDEAAVERLGPNPSAVPNGSGDHPAGPESSPMPAESPETARHATNGATPMPTPPPLVLVAQKAAKAVRQRKPSAAERLYLQLEETRRQRCEESGVAFVPEDWAPARQNTSLGRFAKLEPPDQERFEAAWAEYLSDDSGAARNPPWSVGWFIASKSTWESRALRGAS